MNSHFPKNTIWVTMDVASLYMFIVNYYRAYLFVTSPKLWAGDIILDQGEAEVQYS